ncbi:hypothetical protein HOY80DRAFT_319844 [Tuber brumale]|nr:hypothetical protein HOY80DRAFT_319844 [Tuber brumale]
MLRVIIYGFWWLRYPILILASQREHTIYSYCLSFSFVPNLFLVIYPGPLFFRAGSPRILRLVLRFERIDSWTRTRIGIKNIPICLKY